MLTCITRLSEELYTKDNHFLLESIQNADDNHYSHGLCPTFEIQLDMKAHMITMRCNELGFTPENVKAICSVGKSTKKGRKGYIGAQQLFS